MADRAAEGFASAVAVVGFTWTWWAPTTADVGDVSPWDPTGGAAGRSDVGAGEEAGATGGSVAEGAGGLPGREPAVVWQSLQELPATPEAVPKPVWHPVQVCKPAALAW